MKLESANTTLDALLVGSTTTASPAGFSLTYTVVVIIVVVVAVVFLLLGLVMYKVYARCCVAEPIPTRDDSRHWLTEDNPHKWVDSNYDITNEDEKKIDLPKKKAMSESEAVEPDVKPGRRLHRPSLSA